MSTKKKIAEEKRRFLDGKAEWLDFALRRCESPIEVLFAMVVLNEGYDNNGYEEFCSWKARARAQGFEPRIVWIDPMGFDAFFPQAETKIDGISFRVDFLHIAAGTIGHPDVVSVIELDGHDFHERTKEQARRDRSRDRLMTSRGWNVVRFTGSEVHENPWEALEQFRATLTPRLAKGRSK